MKVFSADSLPAKSITENVLRHRKQAFLHFQTKNPRLDETFLAAYHSSHDQKGGAYSVCMHRADAATVSFSHIRVTPERVEFRYTPGAPCANKKRKNVSMSRAS